ncbi:MAG: Na+/H+ antiporter [Bacteroidetes bacterium]|nr:Na+/H+ antiporter [Bacteroidota bacterium]
MHANLPFLLAMVAAVVLLEMWANKLRIAYPILLVIAGLLISFVPGLPIVRINPDLIFLIFMPPLLFEASWSISFKEMKKWWRIIGSFAFLVVFFTAVSVAVVVNHFIPGFSIALGLVLGGIVAPPDAVSTGAITKFVTIPRSTSAILEGESLLNDASSLIIYRFALVAVGTGQFIWQQAALSFLWMVVGGVGIGLLLAWIFVKVHKRLQMDASSSITFTLIEPYCMYWVAEQLHCSGVLAVVSGGLFMSTRRLEFLNSDSRIQGFNVWESFVFILNGIVFLIIGLELPEIVEGLRVKGIPLRTAIGYGVLVTGALILVRIISAYMAMLATYLFRRSVVPRSGSRRRTALLPLLLGWCGMRGVVSLAAALAIPVTLDNGMEFPQRNLILFITFIVILLTLVVQGLTLPAFITRSRVFENLVIGRPGEVSREDVKKGLKTHSYAFLKDKHDKGHAGVEHVLKIWEAKMTSAEDSQMNERTRGVFIELLESQRGYLTELNRDPAVDEGIIRLELYQIDLEEERLKRM